MRLIVPFVYEALIVRPRCVKPVVVAIKDEIEVNIKEVDPDTIPVAFKVGKDTFRWDGKSLWDFAYHTEANKLPLRVKAETVKENTLNPDGYKWSCSGPLAPFKNFWFSMNDTMARRHNLPSSLIGQSWLKDAVPLESVEFRKFVDSNRLTVQSKALEIASDYLICNGLLYNRVGEPRYEIVTFGLGNERGSTALFITDHKNPNIADESYFNALQKEDAFKQMERVAIENGNTHSLPAHTNCGNEIQVLIPSAVQVPHNPIVQNESK